MRDIIFRGKRIDNGKFVEGYLLTVCNYETCSWDLSIEYRDTTWGGSKAYDTAAVDPETVGQFTGLTDKNGTKIFEGDLVKPFDDEIDKAVVEYRGASFRLALYGIRGAMMEYGWDETAGGYGCFECEPLEFIYSQDLEVIGNIHDNKLEV